jgi:hypothetical protein
MSRVAANSNLTVVRGTTWEDEFTYTDADGVAIDLTGYSARMQIWVTTQEYGATGTPLLELTIGNGLEWNTAATGRLVLTVPAADHDDLNPNNAKLVTYAYALEVYVPAGVDPLYTIPLVRGKVKVRGWAIR